MATGYTADGKALDNANDGTMKLWSILCARSSRRPHHLHNGASIASSDQDTCSPGVSLDRRQDAASNNSHYRSRRTTLSPSVAQAFPRHCVLESVPRCHMLSIYMLAPFYLSADGPRALPFAKVFQRPCGVLERMGCEKLWG
jgi:hypothetical protein